MQPSLVSPGKNIFICLVSLSKAMDEIVALNQPYKQKSRVEPFAFKKNNTKLKYYLLASNHKILLEEGVTGEEKWVLPVSYKEGSVPFFFRALLEGIRIPPNPSPFCQIVNMFTRFGFIHLLWLKPIFCRTKNICKNVSVIRLCNTLFECRN